VSDVIQRVERAVEEIRAGRILILVDDEDRENEGDLCMAAERVTPEAINFMARYGRGLICLSLTPQRCDDLGLQLMVSPGANRSQFGTAFTVSIEARHGVTTGISAADRATTIRTAIAPNARPDDLVTPGHVFPLRAQVGGVLVRTGQTEGSVDLARMAGMEPAGVICEIMNEDGTMARMHDLEAFAERHGIMRLSVADLIQYRLARESLVERVESGVMCPAFDGVSNEFRAYVYRTAVQDTQFLALCLGEFSPQDEVLVRVHAACFGDALNSRSCDCGALLRESLRQIEREGRGVFLYVLPGCLDLRSQFATHVLHRTLPQRADAVDRPPPAIRGFGLGAQVLVHLGLRRIRLLTNNPKRMAGLAGYGLEITDRVPIPIQETRHNVTFLDHKRQRGELALGEGKP
jgi:3,4-dihydroxy 2-butanone 4-phosphate synthase / GTP cyclohydrolase II